MKPKTLASIPQARPSDVDRTEAEELRKPTARAGLKVRTGLRAGRGENEEQPGNEMPSN